MHSSNNGYMVDLDASPHDVKISQTVTGLVTASITTFALKQARRSRILHICRSGSAGRGLRYFAEWPDDRLRYPGHRRFRRPNNLLEFRETGSPDNQGTYLANVSVGQIVIDETAGNQPNTNDTISNYLFDAVVHQGADPDMTGGPQFAAGISAVVNVSANFGADGPWQGRFRRRRSIR